MEKEHGSCPMCAMQGNHHWMHIIVKVAVALIVFWCGVQFGELKAILHNNYDNYRMMGSYGANQVYYGGSPMMYRGTTSTTIIPPAATASAPAAKK